MTALYRHLTMDDRIEIERLLDLGFSKAEIARRIGVHRATIGRETARGRGSPGMITRTCVRIFGTGSIRVVRASGCIWVVRRSCTLTPG